MCQRPWTQASLQSAAIKITCKEVTNYSDKDEDAILKASSKTEEQFKPVKEFPNLFPKTIPTKLLPLKNVNNRIDPKPGLVCLSTWRLSAHKFG